MADFELPVLEGEDRRRIVEGLKKCFAAYPEAVADLVEQGTRRGLEEGRKQGLAPLTVGRAAPRPTRPRHEPDGKANTFCIAKL